MKVLTIIAETEGNSCTQQVDEAKSGFWPFVRKQIENCASNFADPQDWGAEQFSKEVVNALEHGYPYEIGHAFRATYRKGGSVFGTDMVRLELDPDEDDVLMRWNLTFIVIPRGIEKCVE